MKVLIGIAHTYNYIYTINIVKTCTFIWYYNKHLCMYVADVLIMYLRNK